MSNENKSSQKRLKKMFGERFRAGSYATFAAAILIAIVVMVNLVVSSLPISSTQFDLSGNSIYNLSAQTKQIVSRLDKDVTFYLLAGNGKEDDTVVRLLKHYADLSSHITIEQIDPNVKPTFLNNYSLDSSHLYQNSVIVQSGDRYRLVGYDQIYVTSYSVDYNTYSYVTTKTFEGENSLTNAIHYVSSDTLPKAYTISGHGESDLTSNITSMLEQDGFKYETISLFSLEEIPEDATTLIINAPQSDLSEDEADMLTNYLLNGGSIVLFTSHFDQEAMPNLMKVTQAMGLTIGDGIIIEGNRNMRYSRYPYYLLPTLGDHDATNSLIKGGYSVLVPIAQPIMALEDTEAVITALMTTSDQAYSKLAGEMMTTTEKEDGDTDGPFYIGVVSELGGKLFWVSSEGFLNSNIDSAVSGANSNLFMNVMNWMGGQEDSISIRGKSVERATLTVPQSSSSLWSIIMIGVIPAALIIVGIVIVIRRKRR